MPLDHQAFLAGNYSTATNAEAASPWDQKLRGLREDEGLVHYPDFGLFPDGKTYHYQFGDRRAAMAPFLAHKVAKIKWPRYRYVCV